MRCLFQEQRHKNELIPIFHKRLEPIKGSGLSVLLPVWQGSHESNLPKAKNYLSRMTGRDFCRALDCMFLIGIYLAAQPSLTGQLNVNMINLPNGTPEAGTARLDFLSVSI